MKKHDIKRRTGGGVLFSLDCVTFRECLEVAVKSRVDLECADLAGAELPGAALVGAKLSGANLKGANLWGATLRGAILADADMKGIVLANSDLEGATLTGVDLEFGMLRRANLKGANLRDADLTYATLSGANLEGAALVGANLVGVKLTGAILWRAGIAGSKNLRLPTGETWEEYLAETVPALLVAGGDFLRYVATEASWKPKAARYADTPMGIAFAVDAPWKVPSLYRQHAEQFMMLLDSGQIPLDAILKEEK